MKIKKNLAISDTGFIFDPASGNSFSTNPIGLEVIQLVKQGRSMQEVQEIIVKNYEVGSDVFERDLSDFFNILRKMQLTE